MKKILFLAIVLGAFSLTSCKKERTCSCTGGVTIDIKIPKSTKSDAKKTCETAQSTYSASVSATTCELK